MAVAEQPVALAFLNAVTSSAAQPAATGADQDLIALQHACKASVESLQQLLVHHYQGHVQAGGTHSNAQKEAVSKQRQELLDALMLKLDVAASSLHETLEDLVEQHPPAQRQADPQEVIAYGHRLRLTTFAKMGTISLPPAPQPWQMAQSTLYRVGMQLASKQAQEPKVQVPVTVAPTQPSEAAPAYGQGFALQDGTTLPPEALVRPEVGRAQESVLPPPVPIATRPAPGGIDLGLILNPDMEEVSYTESDEDSDDDDF